jgi:hypothetical protein
MKTLGIICILSFLAPLAAADDVAVTVYNSNLGVVSETRTLPFEKGTHTTQFKDVSSSIDRASVRFEVVGSGHSVTILEQNYAFDLVSTNMLYDRYVDREITLMDTDGQLISGKLMSSDRENVTLMDNDGGIKIVRLENIAQTSFPELPDGLITQPTLFWLYTSDYTGDLKCRVSYQTSNVGWSAEYVGLLSPDEKNLDLSGWAKIRNLTTKTFRDAALKLVAGDINRAPSAKGPALRSIPAPDILSSAEAGFEEKSFFEYHLYTLPRKTTLASKEEKQISLFDPASTGVTKEYVYRPDRNDKQVEVAISFVNAKDAGLGMPLPAGRVRLFKSDEDGSLVLLGEDQIEHTPRDEELSLRVGYAFDIAAEERMMNQTQISKAVQEMSYEVELRNRKDENVTVKIEKSMYGSWEVVESSLPATKKDAHTLTFEVPVDAGQTVVLKYRVRVTY